MPETMKINLGKQTKEKEHIDQVARKSKKGVWGLYLSVLALIISLGSGYLAVNSSYLSWQLRTALEEAVNEQQANLDRLMSLRDDQFAAAEAEPGAGVMAPDAADAERGNPEAGTAAFLQSINIDRLFDIAPTAVLDASSGDMTGQVWMASVGEHTFYRAGLLELPAPAPGEDYYLWQMQSPASPEAYPVGLIEYDPVERTGRLTAVKAGEWTDYGYLEIVAVQDENGSVSQRSLMAAEFPADTDFNVSISEVSRENYPVGASARPMEANNNSESARPELTQNSGPAAAPGDQLLLQALMDGDLKSLAGSEAGGDAKQQELLQQLEQLMNK